MSTFNVVPSIASVEAKNAREELIELFKRAPIPDDELMRNLGLFVNPPDIKKMLFLDDIYKKVLGVHGVVMEFGVRWGQNLALFQSLRSIYEPFNCNRKIIGFDTFEGFPSVHEKDGNSNYAALGAYAVSENYEQFLAQVLYLQEQESPINHVRKFELVKGDAIEGLMNYLKRNPESIVSLAYFDFDVYKPTKECLEMLKGHLTKGSVIAFDELNDPHFPGETIALKEVFGLDKYRICRSPYSHLQSYIVYE